MPGMTLLTHERYCDEIAWQVEQLRALVRSGAELSSPVPTCPEWSFEELVRHTGGALRWAEYLVRTRAREDVPEGRVPGGGGPEGRGDAAALDAWLAETGRMLVATLREAGADAGVWSWGWAHDSGFWARRMTHELVVHRADAALAVGAPYAVGAEVAIDALDEWLEIVTFLEGRGTGSLREAGRGSIHLHATDAGDGASVSAEWLVEFSEEGVRWRRGHEEASVVLRGPLTELLLAFYRRVPLDGGRVEVLGERVVLELWLEGASFG